MDFVFILPNACLVLFVIPYSVRFIFILYEQHKTPTNKNLSTNRWVAVLFTALLNIILENYLVDLLS